MITNRNSLWRISLLILAMAGTAIPGMAQNPAIGANQQVAERAIVYNQSGIGTPILIVFAILIIVLLIFKYAGKAMLKEPVKSVSKTADSEVPVAAQNDPEGEIHAAIAMALYLYSNELHDQENPVITMIRVSKTYSPWSSKIYGLRKSPR